MNSQEMESLVKQLKAAGLTEEQIMETFFETFQEGKMDRADLEALAEFMGYELTDGFKNDQTPDPIAGGAEGEEGVTKSEAEGLKEIQPGESKEEFEQKVEEAKSGEGEPAPSAEGEEKKEEKVEEQKVQEPAKPEEKEPEAKPEEQSEEKEWEEVQKKFHW